MEWVGEYPKVEKEQALNGEGRESYLGQYYFDENIERSLIQSTYPSYRAYLELTTITTLERGHLIEVTWPGRLIFEVQSRFESPWN